MNGRDRAWHAGFLARADAVTAQALTAHVAGAQEALVLGLNGPYEIEDETDWFIPRHAEPRGLAHSLIEIRNDQLRDTADVARWADLLSDVIATVLEPVQ
jgi:predicted N-formylglutamate amidohydrolase